MVFNALQTYSSGEKVNWNEVSADPSVEPEHPAPTLTITPAAAENGSGSTVPGKPDRPGRTGHACRPERQRVLLDSADRPFGCRSGAFPRCRGTRVASGPATSPGSGGGAHVQP